MRSFEHCFWLFGNLFRRPQRERDINKKAYQQASEQTGNNNQCIHIITSIRLSYWYVIAEGYSKPLPLLHQILLLHYIITLPYSQKLFLKKENLPVFLLYIEAFWTNSVSSLYNSGFSSGYFWCFPPLPDLLIIIGIPRTAFS